MRVNIFHNPSDRKLLSSVLLQCGLLPQTLGGGLKELDSQATVNVPNKNLK